MADPIRELFSQTSWDADGTTTVWNFSFAGPENVPYLSRDHVFASKLNKATGVVTPITIMPGDWIGPATISIVPAVAVGYELTIYRNTPKDKPLVDFQDKASITEASLDRNARQAIFVAAEAADGLNVAIDSVSQIVNYVATAAAAAASATASATAAAGSAVDAANSAGSASLSATNASSSATVATNQAANAMASATSANISRINAQTAESNASSYAASAATNATNAGTSATSASNSAASAASSASTATTQASNAANSASAASTSAGNAATSATNAANSATTATTQAGIATTKAAEAAASAASIAGGPVANIMGLTGAVTEAQLQGKGVFVNRNPTSRNRVINASFRIQQRTILSFPANSATAGPDNWGVVCGSQGVGLDCRRETFFFAGFPTNLKATVTTARASLTATSEYSFRQGFGPEDIFDLRYGTAQALTTVVSFDVSSNKPGTYYLSIRNGALTRAIAIPYTVTATQTRVSVVIPGCPDGDWTTASGQTALFMSFTLAAGTSNLLSAANTWQSGTQGVGVAGLTNFMDSTANIFRITGVQWELGSVATPYEVKTANQYEMEAWSYFRYVGPELDGVVANSTNGRLKMALTPVMRNSPTVGWDGQQIDVEAWSQMNGQTTVPGLSLVQTNPRYVDIAIGGLAFGGTPVTGQQLMVKAPRIYLTAELF